MKFDTSRQATHDPGPPRMLLGVSLLFWGGIVAHPLIGLILAVGTEAAHWTRVRWDFTERTVERAWRLSLLMLFFAAVLIWLNESISSIPLTVAWLPVIFFPLQFVQGYGMHRTIPLTAFSAFTRQRREHAAKHGLPFREIHFAFGQVYFVAIIIATSLGTHADSVAFFPVTVVLIVWAFHRRLKLGRRLQAFAAMLFLAAAAAGGYGGEELLEYLYRRFAIAGRDRAELEYARQSHTAIGKLTEVKLSPAIQWRLLPVKGEFPALLRIASYNSYRNTTWMTRPPDDGPPGDFIDLESFGIDNPFRITARDSSDEFISREVASSPDHPRFILRGSFPQLGLLPIAGQAASLVMQAQNMEINSFGTLRVDPIHPVANATILWNEEFTTARSPWSETARARHHNPALQIPENEAEGIRRVAANLDLHHGSIEEKIARIAGFFDDHFTYTRYLARPGPVGSPDGFVTLFLEHSRRGHCEYFATATALLLREAGVPTRYATGFAVHEIDPDNGQAIIRGTHGHAWCMAWDEESGRWLDVDLTPPDWTRLDTPRTAAWQGLLDRWNILRDDLLVWRSEPGNLTLAVAIILIPLALGGLLIGRRLWTSRQRVSGGSSHRQAIAGGSRTPLMDLEIPASKWLGPRPPGQPLGDWLGGLTSVLPDAGPLDRAISLHRSVRFDPAADGSAMADHLSELVAGLERELQLAQPPSSG